MLSSCKTYATARRVRGDGISIPHQPPGAAVTTHVEQCSLSKQVSRATRRSRRTDRGNTAHAPLVLTLIVAAGNSDDDCTDRRTLWLWGSSSSSSSRNLESFAVGADFIGRGRTAAPPRETRAAAETRHRISFPPRPLQTRQNKWRLAGQAKWPSSASLTGSGGRTRQESQP